MFKLSLQVAKELCLKLHNAKYEAYLVGGCCRDILLGVNPHDFDITTNATPEQIKNVFRDYKTVLIGEKYGTVAIIINSQQYEITTYRSETDYSDNRHPNNVKFETDLTKDLERRDFTINAMALNPCDNKLIDLFNGKEHLEQHIIKAVGNATERFREDALRMIRAIRFSAKLNNVIETDTLNGIKNNLELINNIAFERVKDELFKILSLDNSDLGIYYLYHSGLMRHILPELTNLENTPYPKQHHRYNPMFHMFETVQYIPKKKTLLRFSALIHDIGKTHMNECSPYYPNHEFKGLELFQNIASRLKLSKEETEYVSFMVKFHMLQFALAKANRLTVKKWLSKNAENLDKIDDLFLLMEADTLATGRDKPLNLINMDNLHKIMLNILSEKPALTLKDLAINGHDLLELGFSANDSIGKTLKILLDKVIEQPELNVKETLLDIAKTLLTQVFNV